MKAETTVAEIVQESQNAVISQDVQSILIADLEPVAMRVGGYTKFAAVVKVSTPEEATLAASVETNIADDIKLVSSHEVLSKIIAGLFTLHRKATAFRQLFLDPMNRDKKRIHEAIVRYQEEQRRKAAELQAKLQAEANAKARREQEALEKKAAAMKTVEKQEEYRQRAAEVLAPEIHIPTESFTRTAKRWKVKSVDLAGFLAAAATDASLRGYIEIKETNLARAKAANPMLTVPGIVFTQEEK